MMKKIFAVIVALSMILPAFKFAAAESGEKIYFTDSPYYSETGAWYGSSLSGYGESASRYSFGSSAQACWSIPIEKNGYYRVFFYNLIYENNCSDVKVLISCGDGKEMVFTHKGNASGRFEELGIFELHKADELNISVYAGEGGGCVRTNSVKIEYYPFAEENVYKTEQLQKISGTWHSSSLEGYEGTASVYSAGPGVCRWYIKEEGLTDLYFYNIMTDGNCPTAYVTVADSSGNVYQKEIPHKGSGNETVFLGRYDFKGGGEEYVEISNPSGGYLRINALVLKSYCPGFIANDETDYPKRLLTNRRAEIFEADIGAENIYVKAGSLNGDGSLERPYSDIFEAQQEVRRIIKNGYPENGICVNVMDGTYFMDSALVLEAADSGTEEKPVVWQRYGENVVFTASDKIERAEFKKVTDEKILERIPSEVHGKIYSVEIGRDTSQMSISSPYMVVFDDTAGTLARWPNSGFAYTGDLADIGTRSDSGSRQRGFTYIIDESRIFKWKNEENGWLSGYWMTPYTMDFIKIAEIDTEKMTVSGANGTSLGAYDNGRYTALNMMCELDSEGEWYIENGILYVVMPEECREVYISLSDSGVLKMSGAHDILFKGIDFKNCGSTAVSLLSSCERCGVLGAEIKNTTGAGVSLNGKDCYVRDCDISYVGSNGIQINGGNQYNLTAGGNWAENNTVTKTGRCSSAKAGVTINGCKNRLSNNHIYNVPTHGITGGGMENIIEKNVVERTNLEMGDTGGIYFLNYGMGYGTQIRYNIVKDSVGLNKQEGFANEGALGIYLDDLTSGVEVFGNIIYHSKEPALFGHGGRNLTFKNNVIIDCDESIRLTKTSISKNLDIENGAAAVNIRKFNTDAVNSRYPQAVGALTDDFGEAKYNSVINNAVFNSFPIDVQGGTNLSGTVLGNLEYEDMPKTECTDFYDFDFSQIIADNPDFEPIPVEDIGIYKGGMREDEEDVIYDNRCEDFKILEPLNGESGLEKDVEFKWETNSGGIKKSSVYISEYSDMAFAKKYTCSENNMTIPLDYGKTYYWCVCSEPFLEYPSKMNSNGVFEFTTMSREDKLKSLKHAMEYLVELADETEFEHEDIEMLREKTAEFSNLQDFNSAVLFAQSAVDEFLDAKKVSKDLETDIFDDYESDNIGDKPFGLFQRSTGKLDIKTAYLPDNDNKGVKFNDDGADCHYASRYFYPERSLVEFSTRVIPMQTDGQFSMSLIKTGYHSTKDGVSGANAARVLFNSDGVIYADKDKNYPIMDYSAGGIYDVKIKFSVKEQNYEVYINGELKVSNVPANCEEAASLGSILYDTSDATVDGKKAEGVFYIDNTIIKTAQNYGRNNYLMKLWINGEEQNIDKTVILTGLPEETLACAGIEYETSGNAKVKKVYDNGAFYITVVSGDLESIRTYVIK